jgi:hypothetical protein
VSFMTRGQQLSWMLSNLWAIFCAS